jgi:transposase
MTAPQNDVQISDVKFLPLVSAYAKKIGLVEEIDRLLDCDMEVSPGRVVLALILDALSGRSPLFRLREFFADKDIELLLGEDIPLSKLGDHTLRRVLRRLFEVGTNVVLGAIALRAARTFSLDLSHGHHDTTSHSFYGDYLLYEDEDHGLPFVITHGYSKKHRPDLKQLVQSLLCVDYGIPIYSKVVDGNESDKTINQNLIPEMVKRMKEVGGGDFVYVNDSALITEESLRIIDEWGLLFVSLLPQTYNECKDAITRAVQANDWQEIGRISDQPTTRNRKPASYRASESTVTLYGKQFRVIVVHSDAHDKRRQKKVDKQIKKDLDETIKLRQTLEKIDYACLPDAQAAMQRVASGSLHRLTATTHERPQYHKGRPKNDGSRSLKEMRYGLTIEMEPNEDAIRKLRDEAGCFVLITNTPREGDGAVDEKQLLTIYKDQHMVERNFAFLKDPVFVNALFLKSPKHIEALGLILVLALMIWRLMERTMRATLAAGKSKITGWVKRETSRPTSFMMTTKFMGIFVLTEGKVRRLAKPLNSTQLAYLQILDLNPEIFLNPP